MSGYLFAVRLLVHTSISSWRVKEEDFLSFYSILLLIHGKRYLKSANFSKFEIIVLKKQQLTVTRRRRRR